MWCFKRGYQERWRGALQIIAPGESRGFLVPQAPVFIPGAPFLLIYSRGTERVARMVNARKAALEQS